MMSGGVMTYRVVEPRTVSELRSRLLRAATEGSKAEFVAVNCDDPSEDPIRRSFSVTVKSAQFDAPMAFDTYDQEGNYIQIQLEQSDPVEFALYL